MKNNKFFTKSDRNKRLKKPLVLEDTPFVESIKSENKVKVVFDVDNILDKISEFGMSSITKDEKDFLIKESLK